jgi:hypothetical protein
MFYYTRFKDKFEIPLGLFVHRKRFELQYRTAAGSYISIPGEKPGIKIYSMGEHSDPGGLKE